MEKLKFLKIVLSDEKDILISPDLPEVRPLNDWLRAGKKVSLELIELTQEQYEALPEPTI